MGSPKLLIFVFSTVSCKDENDDIQDFYILELKLNDPNSLCYSYMLWVFFCNYQISLKDN